MIKTGFLLFMSVILLSACGVKPKDVDPPENADPAQFPKTYPSE